MIEQEGNTPDNNDLPEEGELSPTSGEENTSSVEETADLQEETPVVEADTSAETAAETDSVGNAQTDDVRVVFPKGPNARAEITKPVFSPLPVDKVLGDKDHVSFLNMGLKDFSLSAEHYPNLRYTDGAAGGKWRNSLIEAQGNYLVGDAFAGALERDPSCWRQSVTAGAEQLSANRPRFGEVNEPGHRLTGEQAIMKLRATMGLGMVIRVPLWHTGLWLTLKAPSEKALLELDRRIGNEKITLGRISNGLVFSSTSVYTKSYLVNFALAHVYEATMRYTQAEDLKKVILTSDIPTLIWGLLCTIYPQGYPYRQPCVADPSKCQHIVEELIAINKLSFTDDRALTEKQRQHMTQRNKKFKPEELKDYQAEHGYQKDRTLKLREGLQVEMRVSTLEEYENAGVAWVDGIVHDIDQSFGGTIAGEDRNNYIIERAQITALRQYAHYVSKISLNDGQEIIEDPETIADALAELSSDDEIFSNFFNGVGKFIDKSTVSMIALPRINCPACGEDMSPEEKAHPYLVPLDIENLFFTLVDQRIDKALQRLHQ